MQAGTKHPWALPGSTNKPGKSSVFIRLTEYVCGRQAPLPAPPLTLPARMKKPTKKKRA